MTGYVVRRLLLAVPTILGATLIVFLIMRVAPGDVVDLITGESGSVTEEQKEEIRAELGLDDPLPVQYVDWLRGLATLDLGDSLWTGQPITSEIRHRLMPTFEIAVGAIVLSLLVAIPLGTLSAVKQNTPIDYGVRFLSIAGLALPSFWIATLVMLVLNREFSWVPPLEYRSFSEDPWDNISQLIWPMLILGYSFSAIVSRMTRSAVLEVMREDYIRTARAKGLSGFSVTFRHALKNALLPVVTISAGQLGYLIGGSVIMETIFVVPGVGAYIVDSIQQRDYPVVQAVIMLLASVYVFINLATDLMYGWLDPRIRFE